MILLLNMQTVDLEFDNDEVHIGQICYCFLDKPCHYNP